MPNFILRIIETLEELKAAEDLQRQIWSGSELSIDPAHVMLAIVENGGLAIGAYAAHGLASSGDLNSEAGDALDTEAGEAELGNLLPFQYTEIPPSSALVGIVFGFPGLYFTPDGPRAKHCSHLLGVHPDYRNSGVGFALKRAQWQMVRRQGLDCATWTYDPLLSRNAHLNINKLGAVCNTYLTNAYGDMSDDLNAGLPTDRFQVDWWINTERVSRRLSKRRRRQLDLSHFLTAGAEVINPAQPGADDLLRPAPVEEVDRFLDRAERDPVVLAEIPANYQDIRTADRGLAYEWRMHARYLFQRLFAAGYLVTDFIFLPGASPRSFYALSHGESTL